MKYNSLGLPVKESEELVIELNGLLSNFQMYYQNLRGLHWNIRGKRFFDLHLKFEELYNDSQIKIDLIAERVLTLGGTPLHTFSDYIEHSKLQIGKNISLNCPTKSCQILGFKPLIYPSIYSLQASIY